ncbi:MAG: exodeoxyribonuclease VII large subunit [Firmicutes bacterium]|nr:exodeoxyribonuclease VII large subunit [Bacillota bacterium]
MTPEKGIYTVTQVNKYIKGLLLQDGLLQNISILGEISNFKRHRPSGHIYFTLKDKNSVIRCVFFLSKNKKLSFIPAEGMRVVARGNISLYERSGYYQLYVEELKPEGIGALYLAFEQLKEKLKTEGLFDTDRKKPLPRLPRCIGLVTSPAGAAVKDFLTTLKRRFPCVRVLFCPVTVQGPEAPGQIINALKKLDDYAGVEVIVITRGGGSLEELWSFNAEALAYALYKLKTPVISAVGHETDFTIADFVADIRASTPTAAAELVAPQKKDLLRHLKIQEHQLLNRWQNFLQEKKFTLKNLSPEVHLQYLKEKINQSYQRIDEIGQRLEQNLAYSLKLKKTALCSAEEKLKTLDPANVLKRGFALISDQHCLPVDSVNSLQEGQGIHVVFHDGKAGCEVKDIHRKKSQDC